MRHCPGRFLLAGVRPDLTPEALLGTDAELFEFDVAAARDKVVIAQLDEGGLISYKRADGTYLHTLNSAEGFSRKMLQLGIAPRGLRRRAEEGENASGRDKRTVSEEQGGTGQSFRPVTLKTPIN